MRFIKKNIILIIILTVTFLLRVYQLNYPSTYVFDEVYHAFTAKEYVLNHKEAWEWWTKPPPGVAFEWTHPPLAKEIMATSMFLLSSTDSWVWRLPGVLFGVLSVLLVFMISKKIFNANAPALLASFLFSLDGLNFVQSRTGMNDIYFVALSLTSLLFFLRRQFIISAVFIGLTLASKWTGIYLLAFLLILLVAQLIQKIRNSHHIITNIFYIVIIPVIASLVYFLSYIPFFLSGHGLDQFVELQKQMWWYHTGLKASHDYASPWWSWSLNLYPVWYFVEYHKNNIISNIFASGNSVLLWLGSGSIIVALFEAIKEKKKILTVPLLGFFIFWLPWAFSPRIMFLYHFSPSVPFMCMILGYWLYQFRGSKNYPLVLGAILGVIVISFMLLYPLLVGVPLPRNLLLFFFQTNLTKNPF